MTSAVRQGVPPAHLAGRAAGVALFVLLSLWVFWTAGREWRADFGSLTQQHDARQWIEGQGTPADRAIWEDTLRGLLDAEAVRSGNPVLQEMLGNLYRVGARQPWAGAEEQLAWRKAARTHYARSLELRPTDGLTWALMASLRGETAEFGAEYEQALATALRWSPHDDHVQRVVLQTTLEHWERTPQALQNWVVDLYEQGTATRRNFINNMAKSYGLAFESTTRPR
ncbi:MAG: hypothetical protein JNJ71_16995 [Rubrivivax sp.]|nr:hypothetical protein [Rubrivivax sp.]